MNELGSSRVPSWKWIFALGLFATSVASCTTAATCIDPLDINSALNGTLTVDRSQPDAMATFSGSGIIAFPCDAPADQLVLRDGALYEVDETTLIQKMDVQFKGGSVITVNNNCSGLGTYNIKFDLESAGVPNSAISVHCDPTSALWFTANIERADCATGTKKPIGIVIPLNCK